MPSTREATMANGGAGSVGSAPGAATGNGAGAGAGVAEMPGDATMENSGGATTANDGASAPPSGDRESERSADVHRAKVILVGGDGSAGDTENVTALLSDGRTLNVPRSLARDEMHEREPLRGGEVVSVTLSPDKNKVNGIVRD